MELCKFIVLTKKSIMAGKKMSSRNLKPNPELEIARGL
jgi:hypothetical protein